MKKNVIVGQSGGPTAVINASLYGVVYEALNREDSFGSSIRHDKRHRRFPERKRDGYRNPWRNRASSKLIRTTPGSYLGSCRYKLPEDLEDPVYPLLFEKLAGYHIGYFFYIGGNDSMDTVSKLSRYASRTAEAISASSGFRRLSTTTWS